MDLQEKIRGLPELPGVYLYKNAGGEVIYIGKAKNLRARVRTYFAEGVAAANAKTGSLLREAVDLEWILVDNEKEAWALENNLIKQKKPRFNILLRDDKTYPYVKLTRERFPRVYVTRRLKKDGDYFGPYFPANLAYRIVDLIHRVFLVPSCRIDLTRYHPRPCLQFYIHRCLGPCVKELTTPEIYEEAVRDTRLFLEGKTADLGRSLEARMAQAAQAERFEAAARYRDLLSTLTQLHEKQRMAAVEGADADVFGFHSEDTSLAVNLFHMRGGRVLDRREFFWDELPETSLAAGRFDASEFFASLLPQVYMDQQYVPRFIYVPVDFPGRDLLEEVLAARRAAKVEIIAPQRGEKRSLVELATRNARQSFEQRFRVLKPSAKAIAEALRDALDLPETPKRVECFDISHIQGAETVASMVVWENGAMKKSDYRKYLVRTVTGVDDFASMREVVARRYARVQNEKGKMPGLVLVDGGIGQLHAAAEALESLQITHQPLAALAKREEVLYVYGQEDAPIVLDRRSPVLHLVQSIRDEAHRFAVTFHRKRRQMRDRASALESIPGIGPSTRRRLVKRFGSERAVGEAGVEDLRTVVSAPQADAILRYFSEQRSLPVMDSRSSS